MLCRRRDAPAMVNSKKHFAPKRNNKKTFGIFKPFLYTKPACVSLLFAFSYNEKQFWNTSYRNLSPFLSPLEIYRICLPPKLLLAWRCQHRSRVTNCVETINRHTARELETWAADHTLQTNVKFSNCQRSTQHLPRTNELRSKENQLSGVALTVVFPLGR